MGQSASKQHATHHTITQNVLTDDDSTDSPLLKDETSISYEELFRAIKNAKSIEIKLYS